RRDNGGRERDHDAGRVAPAAREDEHVRSDHDQLPVREVDEPQDAEDETDAYGDQRVDGAEADRGDQRLEMARDGCSQTTTWRARMLPRIVTAPAGRAPSRRATACERTFSSWISEISRPTPCSRRAQSRAASAASVA